MDYSLLGSSVLGILQGKNTGVGCHFLLRGIFPTQRVNPGLPTLQTDSLLSEQPGKPKNVTDSHWTADTQTRGKLGKGGTGLVPSIQRNIKGPSAMVETYSRSKWLMRARCEALAEEGWVPESNSRTPCLLHSFSSIWNCSFSHSLSISCPFSSLTPNTLSHETILHSSLFLLGCQGSHLSSLMKDHLILLHHLYMCTWLLSASAG